MLQLSFQMWPDISIVCYYFLENVTPAFLWIVFFKKAIEWISQNVVVTKAKELQKNFNKLNKS